MLTKHSNMSAFLSFHVLAASRGDGLRPEFVDLFKRLAAGADDRLSESVQRAAVGRCVELPAGGSTTNG